MSRIAAALLGAVALLALPASTNASVCEAVEASALSEFDRDLVSLHRCPASPKEQVRERWTDSTEMMTPQAVEMTRTTTVSEHLPATTGGALTDVPPEEIIPRARLPDTFAMSGRSGRTLLF